MSDRPDPSEPKAPVPAGTGVTRYDEEEARRIFELASEESAGGAGTASGAGGMTLAELQAIGREVGLPEDAVARAAATVRGGGAVAPRRSIVGIPVSVGRTAPLPGPLSDRAWELLVVEMRDLFQARGKTESHGRLRQWTNGNLQVLLEPSAEGYQLRMRTTSQRVQARLTGGAVFGAVGSLLLFMQFLAPATDPGDMVVALVMLVAGVVLNLFNAVDSRRWADTREEQFARLALRAAELADDPDQQP